MTTIFYSAAAPMCLLVSSNLAHAGCSPAFTEQYLNAERTADSRMRACPRCKSSRAEHLGTTL